MDFQIFVADPNRLDILHRPFPVLQDGGELFLPFKVINRSGQPMREARISLLAEGEHGSILALKVGTLEALSPGETRPCALRVKVDVTEVVTLKLRVMESVLVQASEPEEVPLFVIADTQVVQVEEPETFLLDENHLVVVTSVANVSGSMLPFLLVQLIGYRSPDLPYDQVWVSLIDLEPGERRQVTLNLVFGFVPIRWLELFAISKFGPAF